MAGGFEVLQAFIAPEVIITQSQEWEESFFWNSVKTHKKASNIPHIALPAPSVKLMWIAHIDSTALQGKPLGYPIAVDLFDMLTLSTSLEQYPR